MCFLFNVIIYQKIPKHVNNITKQNNYNIINIFYVDYLSLFFFRNNKY